MQDLRQQVRSLEQTLRQRRPVWTPVQNHPPRLSLSTPTLARTVLVQPTSHQFINLIPIATLIAAVHPLVNLPDHALQLIASVIIIGNSHAMLISACPNALSLIAISMDGICFLSTIKYSHYHFFIHFFESFINAFDPHHNINFILGTASPVSILPTRLFPIFQTDTPFCDLYAANGQPLNQAGVLTLSLQFDMSPHQYFVHKFILAEVENPILGLDFLYKHDLIVNIRKGCIDLLNSSAHENSLLL